MIFHQFMIILIMNVHGFCIAKENEKTFKTATCYVKWSCELSMPITRSTFFILKVSGQYHATSSNRYYRFLHLNKKLNS